MGHLKTRIKVRLILIDEDRILLLKQTSSNGGKYSLVGGKVEDDETPVEALIRETREEAGITVYRRDMELVHTLHKRKEKERRLTLYFRASRYKGELRARERSKFKAASWHNLHQIPTNLSPTVKFVLNQLATGAKYSEY